jgi:hypothetical protein
VAWGCGWLTAPDKDAARSSIMELRAAGHSIDEIAAALAAEGTPLNPMPWALGV